MKATVALKLKTRLKSAEASKKLVSASAGSSQALYADQGLVDQIEQILIHCVGRADYTRGSLIAALIDDQVGKFSRHIDV